MTKKIALLLATATCMFGWVAGASATTCLNSTCTITNSDTAPTTLVQADYVDTGSQAAGGTDDSGFFGGNNWGPNVGGAPNSSGPYTTTGLTVSYANTTTGNGMVTLVFNTNFASTCSSTCGKDPNGNTPVYAADIFIKSGTGVTSALTSSFNYGIALGYTATSDGGLAAGLYQATNPANSVGYKTSSDLWAAGGADGTSMGTGKYGGAFASSSLVSPTSGACSTLAAGSCELSPTVLTSTNSTAYNTANAGSPIAVCDTSGCGGGFNAAGDGGFGTLTVSLAGTTASLEALFTDFDIFWGTGDCSNAPIWGNIAGLFPNASVPEPSSLALLASAAIGFGIVRRRKRKGLATA